MKKTLFFCSFFLFPVLASAALPATDIWEVRTTGSDNNGGGFDSASAGTDRSLSDVVFSSGTNLTVDGVTNTDVAPDAYTPVSADVGNVIQITAGAGFTTGFYSISSIAAGKWRLDRSPAGVGTAGGTWALGGALASPGKAAGAMAAGNILFIKSGSYSITSVTNNVSNGCLSPAAGTSVSIITQVIGYNTTRSVGNTDTKPILTASGIATFTLITLGVASRIDNLTLDGASLTSSRGVSATASFSVAHRCLFKNFTNNAFAGTNNTTVTFCEATGCATQPAFNQGMFFGCTAHNNTITGFSLGGGNIVSDCISANNTGGTSVGFLEAGSGGVMAINSLAYGNGSHGFQTTLSVGRSFMTINSRAEKNGGFGYTATNVTGLAYLYNCSGWSNTSGNVNNTNIAAAHVFNFVTLTADPNTNAAGNDFSLNQTSGGGGALRNAALPNTNSSYQYPGLSTLNYLDIGAVQHSGAGAWTFIQ